MPGTVQKVALASYLNDDPGVQLAVCTREFSCLSMVAPRHDVA